MEQANLLRLLGLRELGHECHLLSLNPIGALGPALERNQIPHEGLSYQGRGGWRSAPSVYRKVRSIPADALLMTGHHVFTMLGLGNFCKGTRVLDLHSDHGATGAKSAAVWRWIYRIASRKFQAITFPSDFVRLEAEAIYPPVARISHTLRNPFVLPAPVEPMVRIAAREALGLPQDVPIIGNAGWLIPRKRFDIFLRIGQIVCQQIPDAVLVIVGDGPERERLTILAESLGIAGNVRWLGWQQELSSLYQSLDVLVFNSDWDAMPRTPIEAAAYGVPVVASVIHGGLVEFIEHGHNGFLLSEHDVARMAELVRYVLMTPGEAHELGCAARQRVAEFGSVATNAKRMEALLNGL